MIEALHRGSSHWTSAVLVLFAMFGPIASTAWAQPRVIVLATSEAPVRPAFVEALTIELVDRAAVEAGPTLEGTSLPAHMDAAFNIISQRSATLGVWIDAANAAGTSYDLVLYAIGRRRDVALVKVARVEVASGADVDRALALKVGDFLDELLVEPAAASIVAVSQRSPERVPEATSHPPVAAAAASGDIVARPHWLFIDLGAHVAVASGGPRPGLAIEAGLRATRDRWLIEYALGARAFTAADAEAPTGSAIITDRSFTASARVLVGNARRGVGVRAGFAARALDVTGIANDGTRGELRRIVPVGEIGVDARIPLGSSLALRGNIGAEIALIDEVFTLDAVVVHRGGRARGTATISVLIPLE